MKITSFQDVPHSPKGVRIQTHAVRLYIRAFVLSRFRAFRRTPCVSTFVPSRLCAFVEVRRIVFHSASKKNLADLTPKFDDVK
jgi:hypothetical protein